jgi:hypothetical protein
MKKENIEKKELIHAGGLGRKFLALMYNNHQAAVFRMSVVGTAVAPNFFPPTISDYTGHVLEWQIRFRTGLVISRHVMQFVLDLCLADAFFQSRQRSPRDNIACVDNTFVKLSETLGMPFFCDIQAEN